METVLEFKNISKTYGRVKAVQNLSLAIPKGSVYGILGPNGSGKTTTLGMALSVIHPTSGGFEWFGKPGNSKVLKKVGAILEAPLFYPYMNGRDNLKIVAKIKEVSYARIDAVLGTVGLLERQHDAFKTYSLGMKQRLAIGAALLAEPEVLILDEPTNGLDPQGIKEIRELIHEIAQEGTTILLASHLLDEVEKVCDHVAVLKFGQLLYSGPVAGLGASESSLELAAADLGSLEQEVKTWVEVLAVKQVDIGLQVEFKEQVQPDEVNRRLADRGIFLSHLAEKKFRLEDQFLELISNSNQGS